MSRRIVSVIILLVLLMGVSTFAVQLAKSSSATIVVPDDYLTIQEAIDIADEGDTIFVRNGTYYESIVVNKTISLIGESKEATIVNASGFRKGILITADNVTIKKFTVSKVVRGFGIQIKSSGCLISGNSLVGTHEGIFLDGREPEATVEGNVIADNHVSGNDDCGILLWASGNNQILHNTVVNNSFVGIYLYINSSNNIIKRNEVTDNADAGVVINLGCSYNTLIYNNISYNGLAVEIWYSGVVLNLQCNENKIIANNICNNFQGMLQNYDCNNNTIYHNNFINNLKQVFIDTPPCVNIWDNDYPSGGNYWSNYYGSDSYKGPYQNLTGSDGIGDTPYVIDNNNVDWYPLMEPHVNPLGDINSDGKVDMQDIAIVARAFGSYPGHPNWNPEADVNKDGRIDLIDVALVAKDFGK